MPVKTRSQSQNESKAEQTYCIIMIESPYSGDIDRNIRYLDIAIADATINYEECPYASHGAMTRHP